MGVQGGYAPLLSSSFCLSSKNRGTRIPLVRPVR